MAAEEATLRGYVIGEEGKPIAGWVSLGDVNPQRWLAHSLRVETDEGYEVAIEELVGEGIAPVHRTKMPWGNIEKDEIAQLCYREAPAPEVEVEFVEAIIRGGDPIVVWGEVADHGYAGGEDTQSPATRGGSRRVISRLQARVVAYGEDCEPHFVQAKNRWAAKQALGNAVDNVSLPRTRSKQMSTAPISSPNDDISSIGDYRNRIAHNVPLMVAVIAMIAAFAFGMATHQMSRLLVVVATAACAPLACDAWIVGRFRQGHLPQPSLEVPVIGFLVCAFATTVLAIAMSQGGVEGAKSEGLRAFSYLFALCAVAATVWLWFATRRRREWVAVLHKTPHHLEPLRDGVRGASDGSFSIDVMSIGEMITEFGTAVKSIGGLKSRTKKSEKYANLTYEAELLTSRDRRIRRVRLAEASILTMAKLTRRTGDGKVIRADVITARTPVRLVGRPQNGLFVKHTGVVKSGDQSLLIFAAGVGTNVARELRRLYFRDWIAQILGAVGVVLLIAGFFL